MCVRELEKQPLIWLGRYTAIQIIETLLTISEKSLRTKLRGFYVMSFNHVELSFSSLLCGVQLLPSTIDCSYPVDSISHIFVVVVVSFILQLFFAVFILFNHASRSSSPHCRAGIAHPQAEETCSISQLFFHGYQVPGMLSNYHSIQSCSNCSSVRKL